MKTCLCFNLIVDKNCDVLPIWICKFKGNMEKTVTIKYNGSSDWSVVIFFKWSKTRTGAFKKRKKEIGRYRMRYGKR